MKICDKTQRNAPPVSKVRKSQEIMSSIAGHRQSVARKVALSLRDRLPSRHRAKEGAKELQIHERKMKFTLAIEKV
jgi:hypothetical protein